jgi:hypothetical protein
MGFTQEKFDLKNLINSTCSSGTRVNDTVKSKLTSHHNLTTRAVQLGQNKCIHMPTCTALAFSLPFPGQFSSTFFQLGLA